MCNRLINNDVQKNSVNFQDYLNWVNKLLARQMY